MRGTGRLSLRLLVCSLELESREEEIHIFELVSNNKALCLSCERSPSRDEPLISLIMGTMDVVSFAFLVWSPFSFPFMYTADLRSKKLMWEIIEHLILFPPFQICIYNIQRI